MLARCSTGSARARAIPLCSSRLQSTTATPPYPQHYAVPHIQTISKFQPSGIPGLLSSQGLDNAYFARAELYADRLNSEITRLSLGGHASLDVLVKESATNARHVKVFQNASLLQNIAFAMGSIGEVREENANSGIYKPDANAFVQGPDLSTDIPNIPTNELSGHLISNFGSLIEFKTLLVNSAHAINGDGFTWLVARNNNYFTEDIPRRSASGKTFDQLFIVNTYNSGSPKNNDRVGQLDELRTKHVTKNNFAAGELSTSTIPSFEDAAYSKFQNIEYFPLLAIDASPKVWLHDYGVFGKRQYLEQVWKAIDWDIVAERLPADKSNILG